MTLPLAVDEDDGKQTDLRHTLSLIGGEGAATPRRRAAASRRATALAQVWENEVEIVIELETGDWAPAGSQIALDGAQLVLDCQITDEDGAVRRVGYTVELDTTAVTADVAGGSVRLSLPKRDAATP